MTGGMLARAVEPDTAGSVEGAADGRAGRCLNCGQELVGAHCHGCGQAAHIHRSITAWWHDLAHGVLHFDGKIWRTLPLLAWRPGELTRRYVEGERAKFVSPLALFLFSVFLMFAIFSISGVTETTDRRGAAARDVGIEVKEVDEAIARLEAERVEAVRSARGTAKLDEEITELKAARNTAAAGEKYLGSGPVIGTGGWKMGWERLDNGIAKANQNPSLLFYKLQSNAYKFSWALIPLSLPFLWALFLHRRRYRQHHAYDHLVFITYSIAFMSLLLIAVVVLSRIGFPGGWLAAMVAVVPPVHMYRQLRGAYRLGRAGALWRTIALIFFSILASVLFFLLLLALGVLA